MKTDYYYVDDFRSFDHFDALSEDLAPSTILLNLIWLLLSFRLEDT